MRHSRYLQWGSRRGLVGFARWPYYGGWGIATHPREGLTAGSRELDHTARMHAAMLGKNSCDDTAGHAAIILRDESEASEGTGREAETAP